LSLGNGQVGVEHSEAVVDGELTTRCRSKKNPSTAYVGARNGHNAVPAGRSVAARDNQFEVGDRRLIFALFGDATLSAYFPILVAEVTYRVPSVSVRSAKKVAPGARTPTARESAGVLSPNR
jgi:hypothetical protein